MTRVKNLLEEIKNPSNRQKSLGLTFHENSKLTSLKSIQLSGRIKNIMVSGLLEKLTSSYKSYPSLLQIELPKAKLICHEDLQESIVTRRSQRVYNISKAVSLLELANILQLSYGITGKINLGNNITQYLRATPSAGGLYPLELYVISQRVEGLERGIYHYRVAHHTLEEIKKGDNTDLLEEMEEKWGFPSSAAAIIIITAVPDRTMVKYEDRGYRFLTMEAGIVGQSISQLSAVQNIKSTMLGGWFDDELNDILGLDGLNETCLLPICIGKV